jgi:hypothetical protein
MGALGNTCSSSISPALMSKDQLHRFNKIPSKARILRRWASVTVLRGKIEEAAL